MPHIGTPPELAPNGAARRCGAARVLHDFA